MKHRTRNRPLSWPRGSSSGWRGAFAALAAAVAVSASSGAARADQKQECSAAYEQTQTLRASGHLIEAHAAAVVCGGAACPGFLVQECARWLAELDASLPTIVFTGTDSTGADTERIHVSVDGARVKESLDGKAFALNPGEHLVRFEMDGAPAIDQRILVQQGEKNRLVSVAFKADPGSSATPLPNTVPIGAPVAGGPGPTPWIVGGAGFAVLGVGAGFGALALGNYGAAKSACPTRNDCSAAALDKRSSAGTEANVANAMLVVGATAVVTGVVLYIVRRGRPPIAASSGMLSTRLSRTLEVRF